VYVLEDKPSNMKVTISGATNTILQPGGILYFDDPATSTAKYLVDYQSRKIIFTSGTTAGYNIQPSGTVVIFDYQKYSPVIGESDDAASQSAYGIKDKRITDKNIRDPLEALDVAENFVAANKDPIVEGNLNLKGIIGIQPGNTVIVNLPEHGQSGQTYSVIESKYTFNPYNNLNAKVMGVTLNRKVSNFIDTMKEQMLRLRSFEAADLDSTIISLQLAAGSVGVSGATTAFYRSIGSSFIFHHPTHSILNNPNSLLGDMKGGSTLITLT
jgi:hypothetical protein